MINMTFFMFTVVALVFLHEAAHVISARMMNLRIYDTGKQLAPVIHPYAQVEWSDKKGYRILFHIAGILVTGTLFLFCTFFDFWGQAFLPLAFSILLIVETNPFYSDIVLATIQHNMSKTYDPREYRKALEKYMFTPGWYLHFALWAVLLFSLIQFLRNIINW